MEATQQYFKLKQGACQSDPISAYLFLALEMFLITIKSNNIHSLNVLDDECIYTVYADGGHSIFQKDKLNNKT